MAIDRPLYDIVALGELLVDLCECGMTEGGASLFARHAGGAPANLLAACAGLGLKAAFIGAVGRDANGSFLARELEGAGVSLEGLVRVDAPTTLAFVSLDGRGERSFSFYRSPGADTMLRHEDLDLDMIRRARCLHLGSLSLTDEPALSASLAALVAAREAGLALSMDPNIRLKLWKSPGLAKEAILPLLHSVDILKVAEEELALLSSEKDDEKGIQALRETYGIGLVVVTKGSRGLGYGAAGKNGGEILGSMEGLAVNCVDATGAGDAFAGALLSRLMAGGAKPAPKEGYEREALVEALSFANAFAAATTTRKGGLPAIVDTARSLHKGPLP